MTAPEVRVTRGRPTPEELAAAVLVVLDLMAQHEHPPPLPRRPKVDRLRGLVPYGRGAWRRSAWN